MVKLVVAAALCVACQGSPGASVAVGSGDPAAGSAAPPARPVADARAAVANDGAREPREPDDPELGAVADRPSSADVVRVGEDGEPVDPAGASPPAGAGESAQRIAELGAIPAWQAVVDRAQLLARRGQRGVVYGRVGPALMVPAPPPPIAAAGSGSGVPGDAGAPPHDAGPSVDAGLVRSPYLWLVDDSEGNGALGIRIALGDKAKEGDRIAAGGAWVLDEQRQWYWKADTVQPLPQAPDSDIKEPQPPWPSHVVANAPLPAGARTISVAKDGDLVYFQVVGVMPASDGDGWQIADGPGRPISAILNLPGERPTYGGQDMRAADERWQLKRNQIYWVRIGKVRKRVPDKPAVINARTAPVRL